MLNNKKVLQKSLGFQFFIHKDDQVISPFSLPTSKFFIGREKTSLVCLNHPSVSPVHACVTPSHEGGEIVDLMSENGICINGQKLARGHFTIGDRILIGSVELRVAPLGEKTTVVPHAKKEKTPGPSPSPVSPLTLIDGEYCNITFEDGHFTPLNIIPILKQDFSNSGYIDFHENKEGETEEIIHKEHSGQALEVTILLNGTVMSVDYLPLKDKTYSIGAMGRQGKTIGLDCLNGSEDRSFIKITRGNIQVHGLPHFKGRYITKETGPKGLPIEEEVFEFKPQSIVSLERKTVQIFIRHRKSPPPSLKAAPFFTKVPNDHHTAFKVFATVMSLMLLLLLVDTEQHNPPKKKISVIYRTQSPPPKAPLKKMAKAQPKKLKRKRPQKRPSSPKRTVAKTAPPKRKSPVKSYSFSAKGQLNSFFKSAKSAKASKVLKNTANTHTSSLDIARNLSAGRATASLPSSRLGDNFKGDYDHSVGSQGLSQKRGISTAYEAPTPKVVLGLMDPELLRQILREYMPQFRHCYQKELLRNDKVQGVIHLKFRIISQGRIKNAAVQSKRAQFSQKGRQCMLKVLSLIPFPSPKGKGVVDINQPLNFTSTKV